MRTIEDARTRLRAALDAGDLAAARRAVRGWPPLRGPDAALLWIELLWADRELPDRRAIAETLLDAFPELGEVVQPCAEVLLDELGGFVPGDPPDAPALARRVVGAVDGCLAARADYGDDARGLLQRTRLSALTRSDASVDEVAGAWEAWLDRHPDDGSGWYELGLWLKYRGAFREGLGAALQAYRYLGAQPAVLWNVGICATGCGAVERAVEAWRALGMDAVATGGVAVVPGLPRRRVRLVSDDRVYGAPGPRHEADIWIDPLGPCDGVVLDEIPASIGVRRGDRLLHDGTPLPGPQTEPRLPALAVLGA